MPILNVTCGSGKASEQLPKTVTPDQEVWVKALIQTACRMALALQREKQVRADDPILYGALDGLADGAAIEIITTLGFPPVFVNLRTQRTGTFKIK